MANTTGSPNFPHLSVDVHIANITDGQQAAETFKPSLSLAVGLLTAAGLLILVGIVGNVLVMVLIAGVKSMQTNLNRCLFSLAITDLIILVALPVIPVITEFPELRVNLGSFFCSFIFLYDRGSSVCSVLTFLYMTMDRYIAVCHPLKSRVWAGKKTVLHLVIIWAVSLTSAIPYTYMGSNTEYVIDNETFQTCSLETLDDWMIWYDTSSTLIVFFFPVPFLIFFYSKMIYHIRQSVKFSKKTVESATQGKDLGKVVTMLLIVVVIFVVCQLPLNILALLDYHFPRVFSFHPLEYKAFVLLWGCRILFYTNSAANPAVYFLFGSKFREAFYKLFCQHPGKLSRARSEITHSARTIGGKNFIER